MDFAHGDISRTNMMCKMVGKEWRGVLNDFDLAAIMKYGSRSPDKKGWERTGTLPFMALDLLEFAATEKSSAGTDMIWSPVHGVWRTR